MQSKLKIALVDDDPEDREFFQESLQELSIPFHLDMYPNGQQFLDALSIEEDGPVPDIVFLDLNMPILNGIDTLRHVRNNEKFKKIPIIAIYSTSTASHDHEQTFRNGADAFISKPNDYNELKGLLRSVLEMDWKGRVTDKENFVIGDGTK